MNEGTHKRVEVFPLLSTHLEFVYWTLKKKNQLFLTIILSWLLLPTVYQHNFTIQIRVLLFLFLCVSHLPHLAVSNHRSFWNQGCTNNTCFFCKSMSVLISCLQSAFSISLVSFTICSFPAHLILQLLVTNPLAGAHSLGKTHCTFHIFLSPFSSIVPGPRTFPEAATLFDTGFRANHIGFYPKALSSPSNSILRYYHPESKFWPTSYWCPPLLSLYLCYSCSRWWVHSTWQRGWISPIQCRWGQRGQNQESLYCIQSFCGFRRCYSGVGEGGLINVQQLALQKRNSWFVVLADFPGVNTPFLANVMLITMGVAKSCAVAKRPVEFLRDK